MMNGLEIKEVRNFGLELQRKIDKRKVFNLAKNLTASSDKDFQYNLFHLAVENGVSIPKTLTDIEQIKIYKSVLIAGLLSSSNGLEELNL